MRERQVLRGKGERERETKGRREGVFASAHAPRGLSQYLFDYRVWLQAALATPLTPDIFPHVTTPADDLNRYT